MWDLKLSDMDSEKRPRKLSEVERWNWERAQGIEQRVTVPLGTVFNGSVSPEGLER